MRRREGEKERNRENSHLLVCSSNVHDGWSQVGPKLGAGHTIQVSPVGGMKLNMGAITCHLPRPTFCKELELGARGGE